MHNHLHSTMVLLKWTNNTNIVTGTIISTFHYGSIKIEILNIYECGLRESTFHYGSIKILFMFDLYGIYL